jgi:hypothetical protein
MAETVGVAYMLQAAVRLASRTLRLPRAMPSASLVTAKMKKPLAGL